MIQINLIQINSIRKQNKKIHINDDKNYDLNQEVSNDQIDKEKIVYMNLKAGEISLHSDEYQNDVVSKKFPSKNNVIFAEKKELEKFKKLIKKL